ncbi:vitamin K epoxide reductase family protein [Patescibacteria group bacterium]|nr:vitamin K epoxide reductase family protein [Patescibacteria group bacterium]
MTRQALLSILIVLTLIGFADSAYLAHSALTADPLVCDIEGLDKCNTVAASPYSKLLGIPLAVYGLGFYAVILLLSVYLLSRSSRLAVKGLAAASVVGALASAYFLFLQVFVIKAICIYCLASAVVSFILAGLVVAYRKRLLPLPPAVLP